tara:strand:+ start:53 stop:178 length:126 start_codon:yes stop_codon:yes gene_type:complete
LGSELGVGELGSELGGCFLRERREKREKREEREKSKKRDKK